MKMNYKKFIKPDYINKYKLLCSLCQAPNTLIDKVIPIKEEGRLKQIKIEEL